MRGRANSAAASTVRKRRIEPMLRSSRYAERQTELIWSHKVRLESRTTPKSFTFGWNEIKLLPISRCPVPDTQVRDRLPATIVFVLSSFSLSLSLFIQTRTRSTQRSVCFEIRLNLAEGAEYHQKICEGQVQSREQSEKVDGCRGQKQREKNRSLGNTEVKPLALRGNVVYNEGH